MSRRLIGSLVVLIGTIWLVGAGLAAISIRHEIDEVFDSSLRETAQRLLPLAIDDLDEHAERDSDDDDDDDDDGRELADLFSTGERKEHLHYQIRNAKGHVMVRSHDASRKPFPAPLKRGYFDRNDRRYFTEASPDMTIFVQVAELPGERQEAINAVRLGLGTPLLGLLPLAALVIYWTVRRTTRPIVEVQHQIGMRSGENLEPIDPRGLPGELQPIIHDMNRLLERLKAALEAERSFASNSAHELRNPIAAARAQAEIIAAGLRGTPDQERANQLIETLGRLGQRIEKMLQLARAEAGLGLGRTETDLLAITRLVVEDYARRPQLATRLSFEADPSRKLLAAIDPDALGIALQNLIDNALSYGASGAKIDIVVGPGAVVRVINEGPVVSPGQLAKLKHRFERAATGGVPGTGLGLSIVEEIMQQAGGRLELHSPARGRQDGFEAILVFPPSLRGNPP
jgi:two-component system OmpR family sensor kinase